MSVNSVQQFLNVRDSHLRVVSGNVHADQMVLGGITVDTSHGLQSVTDTSNVTTNTIEFSNATTAFVTTANAAIGGNTTIGGYTTVGGYATIGGDLTVSGNTFYSNNTSINIDSNVVVEFTGPHDRGTVPLKKYPEVAFDDAEHVAVRGNDFETTEFTSNVLGTPEFFFQGGHKITSSGSYNSAYYPYRLFDNQYHRDQGQFGWYSRNITGNYNPYYNGSPATNLGTESGGSATVNGEYVTIEMPKKICVKEYKLYGPNKESEFPQDWTIYGSNDGTEWVSIDTQTNQVVGFRDNNGVQAISGGVTVDDATERSGLGFVKTYSFTNTNYYNNYAIVVTKSGGSSKNYFGFSGLEFYGYEEDPPAGDTSVDTTFTSIMNTPQTIGANVYVDAKLSSDFTNQVTGPTPNGTNVSHDNTNKYWEMNGELTSNIIIEANTFLSGDAPHTVSMWFNSSDLEANVSNSCIFSILNGQEKIHHEGAAHSNRYGLNWFSQKLHASDGAADDRFGSGDDESCLAMTGDGSIVVVGAKYDETRTGSVYIFIKDANGLWREVQKLTASDATAEDRFGGGVDISSDGNYIVIGARLAHSTDGQNTSNVGKVYIFKRTTGTNSWVEQQILSSSQEDADDHFGRRVSISGDGTYVVTAAQNDDEDANNAGGVYVFKRTGNTWSAGNRLTITSVAAYDYIASSLDISTDGNFIAVGAGREEDGAQEDDDGAVFMFARTGDNTWTQQQKISNPDVSGVNNYFGGENQGVSISSDGTYLIVGAYGRAGQNGAVFFYKRTGSSTSDWTWSIMLPGSTASQSNAGSGGTYFNPINETSELFGRAVKMSPDGLTALVHARMDEEYGNSNYTKADVGVVYVYNRSGDNWVYSHEVKNRDTSANDNFGSILAISTDGSYFAAGMFRDDDLGGDAGAVYVFTRDTTQYLDTDLKIHPNTWHNLTYTYGGGGGYKAMYLDGRKVTETHRTKDTFMKYPPMEMASHERNGYRVSHSSQHASYPSWHVFDRETTHLSADNSWITSNYMYSTSDGTVDKAKGSSTFVDGVLRWGEWIQMKFPKKMKIQTVELAPQTDSENLRSPRDGIFCGSNDGITWEKLHEYTNKNWVSGITWRDDRYESFVMDTNLDKAYRYIRFIIERVAGASGYAALAEIKFYGHEENDIIRLPDPTNLIKFPHVPLRTHGQRGYVVSVPVDATNGYNTIENVGQDRRAWMVFDGLTDGTDKTLWQMGNNSSYTNGSGDATSHAPVVPGHTTRGGWVKLELPNKVLLSKIRVYSQNAKTVASGSEGVNSAKIYGSNNDSDWDVIKDTYALNYADTSVTMAEDTISTSTAYKYIIFQITKTGGGPGAAVREIEYYGIEQGNSVPVQIGGGNIDKIANFRVYNRSLNEDQILEIWDSQKDQFRGVKSSMTLHKGRLGLGTTEPEGRLSILDEPHIIERFPPGPMNRYQSYFDGYGMFSASSSSYNTSGNGGNYNAWKAFRETYVGGGGWLSGPDTYNNTSGLPTAKSDNINGKRGEWLQLALPFKILLRRVEIASRTVSLHPRALRECTIWGSNDSTNWEELKVFMGRYPDIMDGSWGGSTSNFIANTTGNVNYVDINSTKAYSFYRAQVNSLHVTEYGSEEGALISDWRLYGSREQSQSTWNDGELVTTKSLTVPRIGPSLGYQIPRRDKLILEYDTSLPIHQERPIDTSGNSYDGTYSGHVRERSWNADRAFNFDGTTDITTTTINRGGSSDWIHSISFWFKLTRDQRTGQPADLGRVDPFSIGTHGTSTYSACDIHPNDISWYFYSNDASYDIAGLRAGDWHHIVFSYEGGGERQSRRCFFDGVEYRNRVATLDQAVLNMEASPNVYIGGDGSRGSSYFEGEIAKFRIYGCALTLSEAIQLYKEGPKTSPHHLQLVDSTMTIGSHDHNHIAQLDVAGHILAGSQTIHTFTGQHRCFPDEPMEKGLIVSAKKNKFVKLNGFATGQKAITIDESLPIVSLSNVAQDKACFGVVSSIETPAPKRRQTISGVISQVDKLSGDNRAIVNSVGEGAIWVVDTNGSLESGDYITTSNVAGYGQKQDDDVLHNYTVAKITMDCDFTGSNVAVQTIKREQTGLQTITEDTWNELVDYDRSSNTEAEITTYYQIQRGENVLDENGQLQFEDKTGATEAPYERRFLDASGIQTDEANAVHIAAFVGCTYHCG